MSKSAQTLRLVRQTHLYFGLFIAPALLFFAFTGALQTLSIHEAHNSDYKPPVWIEKIAQLHKNQTLILAQRKQRPATAPEGKAAPAPQPDRPPVDPPATGLKGQLANTKHVPMKIFALLVSLGLFTSTLTGIYMAYRYNRSKVVVTALLLAGILLPLALLRF